MNGALYGTRGFEVWVFCGGAPKIVKGKWVISVLAVLLHVSLALGAFYTPLFKGTHSAGFCIYWAVSASIRIDPLYSFCNEPL